MTIDGREAQPARPSEPVALTERELERLAWRIEAVGNMGLPVSVRVAKMRRVLAAALASHPEPVAPEGSSTVNSQDIDPVREAWRSCFSKIINALAAMLNAPTPDKLFDLNAYPCDPIKDQIVRIRTAVDEFGRALKANVETAPQAMPLSPDAGFPFPVPRA